jgi:predicted transcriptional regulator
VAVLRVQGALTKFSLCDLSMTNEEQIRKWAEEAEAGYDVEELKRKGRGRPGRGAEPMQVVAVRLTAEELQTLDAAALKHEMNRSEAIRAALAHFATCGSTRARSNTALPPRVRPRPPMCVRGRATDRGRVARSEASSGIRHPSTTPRDGSF